MQSLTWPQVNAWRLSQHCLSSRLERPDFLAALTPCLGVQAQVMSAAEMALWARVDGLTPQDVRSALWQDRTLIKTWAMRGALHLIAASELPLFIAARSLYETGRWNHYFDYYGITPAVFEAYIAAASQVLSSEPMTREQFAAAIAERIRSPQLLSLVASKGWGTPLKPLAWSGDLCFGPNQGRNVTFVHPAKWLGGWQPVDPHQALQEIVRRYLRAYGPATPEIFARWWGGGVGIVLAKKAFKSIESELEPVEIGGWRAVALRSTLDPIQNCSLSGTVNLLPLFDAYLLGLGRGLELGPILSLANHAQVFRPQGWISAVVLVDGYIQGVWELKTRRAQTILQARPFSAPTPALRQGIEAEAARLNAFLNTALQVEIGDTIS